jgi:hypothetical protein
MHPESPEKSGLNKTKISFSRSLPVLVEELYDTAGKNTKQVTAGCVTFLKA